MKRSAILSFDEEREREREFCVSPEKYKRENLMDQYKTLDRIL